MRGYSLECPVFPYIRPGSRPLRDSPYFTVFPFFFLLSLFEAGKTHGSKAIHCPLRTASLDNSSLRLRLASALSCRTVTVIYSLRADCGKGGYNNRSLTGLQKGMFLSNDTGATRCSGPLHCGYIISPHRDRGRTRTCNCDKQTSLGNWGGHPLRFTRPYIFLLK